jgi:cytochrome oxidase Cu insertion factor (SCO1/SenC/PrrC family)
MRARLARLAFGLAATWLAAACTPPATRATSTTDAPREGAPFLLHRARWLWTDERGDAVAFSGWRGEPVIVAAFYTSCSSTCPRTIEALRRIDNALRASGARAQMVLVTIDPDTDTPERLAAFKRSRALPESWRLLRGSSAQTRELLDVIGVHAIPTDPHVVHDSYLAVFDADGHLARRVRADDAQDAGALLP